MLLDELRALLGGAVGAKRRACSRCLELLRAKSGSVALLSELSNLRNTYCVEAVNGPAAIQSASAALKGVEGREMTWSVVAKLVAAVEVVRGGQAVMKGEKAMLNLWVRRSDVFSESLSRTLLERWRLANGKGGSGEFP
jgi:hypothetical protein